MKPARLLLVALLAVALAGCSLQPSATQHHQRQDPVAVAAAAKPSGVHHPPFRYTLSPLPAWLKKDMRSKGTWRPGCPVPMRDLRYLTMRYWDFRHDVQTGPMVVNKAAAKGFVNVFRRLYLANFPIKKMHLATRFYPNRPQNPRDKSDWTTAFNCRVTNHSGQAGSSWSMHAYGLAVDVNPMQNPYVRRDGYIFDVYARKYRNRHQHLKGMIHAGDVVVRAFESIGWHWGGYWSGDKDYMHLSSNGR